MSVGWTLAQNSHVGVAPFGGAWRVKPFEPWFTRLPGPSACSGTLCPKRESAGSAYWLQAHVWLHHIQKLLGAGAQERHEVQQEVDAVMELEAPSLVVKPFVPARKQVEWASRGGDAVEPFIRSGALGVVDAM